MQCTNDKVVLFGRKTLMVAVLLASLLLASCGSPPASAPTTDPSLIQTQSAQTVVAQVTAGAPPATTIAPPPGPTPDPAIPASVIAEPQPGQPSATANYNTLIYGGPGTNYVTYGAFLGGKQAIVVGKSADGLWWVIDVPVAATKVGWVSAGWVTVSGAENVPVFPTPPVPPSTVLVPPGPDDPQAVSISNTYVRTGPGDVYPAYGIASAGAKARVIGRSADGLWLVVRLDPKVVGAGYGWVALQFVQAFNIEDVQVVKESAPPVVEAPPAPGPGVPSATATDYVNVRIGPGTNFTSLLVAPPGASGVVTGRSADNRWWQVQISTRYIPSGLGWVSQDFVITTDTNAVPVVEAPAVPNPPVEPPASTSCTLTAQDPADGTVFAPNTLFETTWTVQNTSQTAWDSNNLDVRFVGSDGVALHQGSDLYDLANNVDAGQTYVVTVSMIAPAEPGTYAELWGISGGGDTSLCQFYVTIQVQ